MLKISEHRNIIHKLLGTQQVDENCEYRLASYCHIVEYNGVFLLYNNFTKKLYEISKKEKEIITTPQKYNDLLLEFIKEWIIVKKDYNEIEIAQQMINLLLIKAKSERKGKTFVIFPTTDCNARCYYCFEHGCTRVHMSDKTANDVADYIITKSNGQPIYIKWFGGEPLYNCRAIDIITKKLHDANISFRSRMISNGYLFDEDNIKTASNDWFVDSVMITLDGTEKVYNKTKNYIYNDEISPFFKVINNIENLMNHGIRVTIRLNMSEENFEDLKQLVYFLKERFTEKKPTVFAIVLYDLDNSRTLEENQNLYKKYLIIEKMLVENKFWGYNLKEFATLGGGCMAENDFAETISPTGLLGKCEHFTEGERMFGSIYSEEVDVEAKNYFKQRKVIEKCYSCPLFPTCGGVTNCPTENAECASVSGMVKIYSLERAMIADYKKNIKLDDSDIGGRYEL